GLVPTPTHAHALSHKSVFLAVPATLGTWHLAPGTRHPLAATRAPASAAQAPATAACTPASTRIDHMLPVSALLNTDECVSVVAENRLGVHANSAPASETATLHRPAAAAPQPMPPRDQILHQQLHPISTTLPALIFNSDNLNNNTGSRPQDDGPRTAVAVEEVSGAASAGLVRGVLVGGSSPPLNKKQRFESVPTSPHTGHRGQIHPHLWPQQQQHQQQQPEQQQQQDGRMTKHVRPLYLFSGPLRAAGPGPSRHGNGHGQGQAAPVHARASGLPQTQHFNFNFAPYLAPPHPPRSVNNALPRTAASLQPLHVAPTTTTAASAAEPLSASSSSTTARSHIHPPHNTQRQQRPQNQQRSFTCPENNCGKVFYRKHHLVSHLVSHTVAKPFKCPRKGCSASFRRKQDLRRHIRSVPHEFSEDEDEDETDDDGDDDDDDEGDDDEDDGNGDNDNDGDREIDDDFDEIGDGSVKRVDGHRNNNGNGNRGTNVGSSQHQRSKKNEKRSIEPKD
ncbi:hypothetical protein HDU83_000402, partial [Entophlyctis luteolus]